MKMDLNSFLGHTTSAGRKSNYLSGWKKRGKIDTWLHTQAPILAIWRHGIPRIVERTDKETKEKSVQVWSGNWPCWEDEDVLKKQYRRDRDTGLRTHPPVICPVCKLLDYIRDAVEQGEIEIHDELFHFEGDDPDKAITLHAGGMYNGFNVLEEDEKKALRSHGVNLRDAWKENGMAKASYAFAIVDNDNPQEGVQIAIETVSLGEQVQSVIGKAMLDADEEGNPMLNPYAIRWIYNATQSDPRKKYDAAKVGRIKLTDAIEELISSEPPTEAMEKLAKRLDPSELMERLQEAYCGPEDFVIPFDELFAPAIAWFDDHSKGGSDKSADEEEVPKRRRRKAASAKREKLAEDPKPARRRTTKKKSEVCPDCGEFMAPDGCPNCSEDEIPY
jgi:hypothetical protein